MSREQDRLELWQAGRAAWPGIALAEEAFIQHAAALEAGGQAPDPALARAHAGDLYLACACAQGVPGAVEAFERLFLGQITPSLLRVEASSPLVDEVRQLVCQRLFVPEAGARARIAEYAGRGSLLTWVRVAALRTALNLHQKNHREVLEDQDLAAALPADQDPEMDYIRARCGAEFKRAVQDAMLYLSAEERNALRLHLCDGLDIGKIGAAFGVHRATASRWLAGARETIARETQRLLRERLHLTTEELDSLGRAVRSQIDLSLPRLLRDGPG